MTWFVNLFKKSAPVDPMPHIALVFPARLTNVPYHELPEAHCTIMYLGTTDTVTFTPEDVIAGLADTPLNTMLWATVTGTEMFGDPAVVPVLRVSHNMLGVLNGRVTAALAEVGITDPSIYANEYKPHITVPQSVWDNPPQHALLSYAELWWGGEHMSLRQS